MLATCHKPFYDMDGAYDAPVHHGYACVFRLEVFIAIEVPPEIVGCVIVEYRAP